MLARALVSVAPFRLRLLHSPGKSCKAWLAHGAAVGSVTPLELAMAVVPPRVPPPADEQLERVLSNLQSCCSAAPAAPPVRRLDVPAGGAEW